MLFLNNKPLELPESLINELRAELEGGKVMRFPKKYQSKTVDNNGNQILEYPAARTIPLFASVDLDMETLKTASKGSTRIQFVNVRFCNTAVQDDKGKMMYSPVALTNFITLHPQNYELYWFLLYCSNMVEGGFNAASNKLKNYACVIWNPEKDEKEQAEKESLEFEVGNIIYNVLPEDKLRNIAAGFGVTDSQKGRILSVRTKLLAAVKKDETKPFASGDPSLRGFKYLLKLAKEDFDFSLRANITKAIEFNICQYAPQKKGWYFLGKIEPGVPVVYEEKIVGCEPTMENKENYLHDFLLRTPEMKSRLEARIKEMETTSISNEGDVENLKTLANQYREAGDVENLISTLQKWKEVAKKLPPTVQGELNNLLKQEA